MADDNCSSSRDLDQTPTWAVSIICAAMILISFALEKFLHKLGSWFLEKHKKAMFEALEKVKSELMILGFISLMLTFSQSYIVKICIPDAIANHMLPCPYREHDCDTREKENTRRLLWYEHRSLASEETPPKCKSGFMPLVSVNGLHQLHILIFFLAIFHVVYSALVMAFGRLKIRGWKTWEDETLSHDYEFSNDPSRFRLTHETSFVRAHTSFWTRHPFFFYIGCFFRQFFRSVSKADYFALRNGFITLHLAPGSKFNFQKYILRSLEDDFKVVVGVSPVLWATFAIFLLININGWRTLLWASLIPLLVIMAVGTKLQAILTKMALEITDRHAIVQGIPLVQASDQYFWFDRPTLVLHLIHFSLFQSAFQLTYFFWILYSFGISSCFHQNWEVLALKIIMGVGVLFLCSYITLPLYALIAQMGSNMKKSIFDEQTSKALKKWHDAAKKRNLGAARSPVSPIQSLQNSSGRILNRFRSTGSVHSILPQQDRANSCSEIELLSPTSDQEFHVAVDKGADMASPDRQMGSTKDFSFSKPHATGERQ